MEPQGSGGVSIATLACVATTSAVLAVLGSYSLLKHMHDSPSIKSAPLPTTPASKRYSSNQQGHKKRKQGQQMMPAADEPYDQNTAHQHSLPSPQPPVQGPRRDPCDPSPRDGYLEWDDYFMALAFLSAQRSKDPNKQVGAVIVGPNKVILAIGYNGFPRGCPDGALPWSKVPPPGSNDSLMTKYPYVVHAEANALLNKNTASLSGASVYVTMFPCNECAKLLIQAGITEVVYHEAKVEDKVAGEGSSVTGMCDVGCCDHKHRVAGGQQAVDASPCSDQQQQVDNVGSVQSCSSYAPADACYVASLTLLRMAGVGLRQHKLQRALVLGPP